MARYTVEISPAAKRQIKKLPQPIQARILIQLDKLEKNPRPWGAIKLAAEDDLYRIRVGDYRVIYQIHDRILLVLVAKVAHRRESYR